MPAIPDPLQPYLQPGPTARLCGVTLRFRTAGGLFSPDRIDDGTRLLLDHLPPGEPSEVLDVGCGYGALGLPIAASRPSARVTCVDRDALAAATCGLNARENGLSNVEALPSLGHITTPHRRWDWVLCNVPARIGDGGIVALVEGAFPRLSPDGEVRVVVIRDLGPVMQALSADRGWLARRVAEGARHEVWVIQPGEWKPLPIDDAPYGLDRVDVEAPGGPLQLERFQDASEAPSHLQEGLPLLLACLPRHPGDRALCWRPGAGAAPLLLARRGAAVTAADRDLLALDYVRRNARAAGGAVETVSAPTLDSFLAADGRRWPLVVGEATPAFGPETGLGELRAACRALGKGGEALWLVGERLAKSWLAADPTLVRLASRARWMVVRGGPRT